MLVDKFTSGYYRVIGLTWGKLEISAFIFFVCVCAGQLNEHVFLTGFGLRPCMRNVEEGSFYIKISTGEICVPNFVPPCEWGKSG